MKLGSSTYLAPEQDAYPNGAKRRKCKALLDGKLITCWCGIPDTYFSIPAFYRKDNKRIRGWLSIDNNVLIFNEYKIKKDPNE